MVLTSIFFFFAVALFIYNVVSNDNRKKYKLPPGPRGIPFIGNSLAVSGRPCLTYSKWQETYGEIFMVRFGPIRVMVLGSAKLIKQCFQNPMLNGRPAEWSALILTQGRYGLLTTEGEAWEEQRRFTARNLRTFGVNHSSIETHIMSEVNEFTRWIDTNVDQGIEFKPRFELAVASALWRIIATKRFRHDDAEKLELFRNLHRTFGSPTLTSVALLIAPILTKIMPNLIGYSYAVGLSQSLYAMLEEEIDDHRKSLPKSGIPRDFIDAYLMEIRDTVDPNSTFYKDEGVKSLKATIAEFFFGATETMSLTLSWAVLYLVMHQDVQKKLQQQIDAVVPKNRHVSLADRANLPYAEAIILEVLRKSSIVVTGVMHRAMEDTQFQGFDVPKATWIMPNMYAIHHSKKIWGDPENFRPERFLSSDGTKVLKSSHLVSFSLGKRTCLGETMGKDECFLFLTNIFHQFHLKPDSKFSRITEEPMKGFLLKPYSYRAIPSRRFV